MSHTFAPLPSAFQRRPDPDLTLNFRAGPFQRLEIIFRADEPERAKFEKGFVSRKELLRRVDADFAVSTAKARLDTLTAERAAVGRAVELADASTEELRGRRRQLLAVAEPGFAREILTIDEKIAEQAAVRKSKCEELEVVDKALAEASQAAQAHRIELGKKHYVAIRGELQQRAAAAEQALMAAIEKPLNQLLDAQSQCSDLLPFTELLDAVKRLPDKAATW